MNIMGLSVLRGNVGKCYMMASRGGKLLTSALTSSAPAPQNLSMSLMKMAGPCLVQVARITAPANQVVKVERPKPWPYKTLSYNSFWQIFDWTYKRIDENSKVICVDGNMAVGKTDFAKRLAEELDFHYVPMTAHDACFVHPSGRYSMKELNQALPEEYRMFDLEQCYRLKNPQSGRPGMLQLMWFKSKVFDYAEGLSHLFNTGQGVVFDHSCWSDVVYIEALKKCGFLTPGGYRYLLENRRLVMCEMFKPHVTIYLDSPVPKIMENIRKRNIDYEVNSPMMSEKYVEEISNAFKDIFIPQMRKHGEVLIYDANNLEDLEIIVEDIERLNLEPDPENEEKFIDWQLTREDDLAYYRKLFGWKLYIDQLFRLPRPYNHPELMRTEEETQAVVDAQNKYSRSRHAPGYNEEDSFFSKLFDMKR